MPDAATDWLNWLLHNPAGKRVGLAIAIAAALVALYLLLRTLRWAAARIKPLMLIAATIGAGIWIAQTLDPSPMTWAVIGITALGALIAWALAQTHAR